MSKRSQVFSIKTDAIDTEGTFDELAEFFNTDVPNLKQRYYSSGSYGGCKMFEIGYDISYDIWGAVKDGDVQEEGSVEELAESLGCAVKTITDTRKFKEYTFRKLRRESERYYYF